MLLILMIIHKSERVGVTLLKDGDLKLKEVREKNNGENYRNKFQFFISQHCCVRKSESHESLEDCLIKAYE